MATRPSKATPLPSRGRAASPPPPSRSATRQAAVKRTATKRQLAVKGPSATKAPLKRSPATKPVATRPATRPSAATKPKRPSAREAGLTVDAWASRLPPVLRVALSTLREVARQAAPAATESIKWGQPVYEESGPFAFIRAGAAHLTFGFWRGVELAERDPFGVLVGDGDRMRHIKVGSTVDVPRDALADLVREAVALNRALGDPTRRK